MRTLGNLRWINEYIGKQYQFGGRGPDHFDCYGLCCRVYADRNGIVLPDWLDIHELDLRGRARAIESVLTSGEWTEKDEPEDGDFVVVRRARASWHMGLFYGGGVLHCGETLGVVYQTAAQFTNYFGSNVAYGEWKP